MSSPKGLPPKTLVVILLAIIVPFIALKVSRNTTPNTQNPTPNTSQGNEDGFDPEQFRGPIVQLEAAVYTNAGIDRLPEGAHALAAAVMAQNRTNPMMRPTVLALETRLNRLADMGGTSPETIQAWEAIRREYFKPASWLHSMGPATTTAEPPR